MYTVYCHTNKLNGKRYVGITKKKPERRWNNGEGYKESPRFYNAIKKYGWHNFLHEILYTGLTLDEAKQKEIDLIAEWNLTNDECGYNISQGGDMCNYERTQVHRDNLSKCMKSRWNTMSEEERRIRRDRLYYYSRPERNPFLGKQHSEETRQLISNKAKERFKDKDFAEKQRRLRDKQCKSIAQYDLSGTLIAIFPSLHELENQTGFLRPAITKCCKGEYKQSYGYIWRYYVE